MKYLVLLLIVMGGIWWIRQQRIHQSSAQHEETRPQVMVRCTHCGTHVPESESINSSQGIYCSTAHRDAHEG